MDVVMNHATAEEARGQYVRSNMDRIERMIRLLDRLAVSAGDTRGLKDLVFHFQQLRTTAAGRGFDRRFAAGDCKHNGAAGLCRRGWASRWTSGL